MRDRTAVTIEHDARRRLLPHPASRPAPNPVRTPGVASPRHPGRRPPTPRLEDPVQRNLSRPHLVLAAGLVVLAAWLGALEGNALGTAYAVIATLVVLTRAVEHPVVATPVRVGLEP